MPGTPITQEPTSRKYVIIERTGTVINGPHGFYTANEQWWRRENGSSVEISAREAARVLSEREYVIGSGTVEGAGDQPQDVVSEEAESLVTTAFARFLAGRCLG